MILECPNCETRYKIPVEFTPEGRKVRCVGCRHVWTMMADDSAIPDISLADFEDEEIVFKEEETAAEEPARAEAEPGAESEQESEPAAAGTGEDLSDGAMEEAFAAAFDAAPHTAAEFAIADGEEPDSPPIVIGRAKKRRGPMVGNVAAGWVALALALAGVMSVAYFQRINVVSALPGAASAYARIGLPVNVRGLEFSEVKYSWETSAGRPVLEVYGSIVNVTSRPLKVPTVVFGLRTKEKVEVYQWAADVRSELLPAGKRTAFTAQIPTPPKSIRDVQVRFAKVR